FNVYGSKIHSFILNSDYNPSVYEFNITKSTGADSEKPSASLYTSYGSFNTSDTRGTVTYGNKNFSLIFSGTNRRSDGYRSNSASKERDGKLTFKYKHDLFLSSIYFETNDLKTCYYLFLT
ncbi:MAG: hypothetical protein RI930_599, partial [Pseudomonadota bacterium]